MAVREGDETIKTSALIDEIGADQLPVGDVTFRVEFAGAIEASEDDLGNPQWPKLADFDEKVGC